MEVPQGNPLCSYLKQSKMSLHFVFFYKIGEPEDGTGSAWGGWYQWDGGRCGERVWEDEHNANTIYT
jgi:hypothetical protein